MVLKALLLIYILPENIGPHCNYKIIGGGLEPPPPQFPQWSSPWYVLTVQNIQKFISNISTSTLGYVNDLHIDGMFLVECQMSKLIQ